jgi:hypothetical protein
MYYINYKFTITKSLLTLINCFHLHREKYNKPVWECTGLSITCSSGRLTAFRIFLGYLTPLKRFFAPKMFKSAPKWHKLMPEILKMLIFVTQFNFKVSKFRLSSTNCKQNAPKLSWKAKKHVPKIGTKICVKVSAQWRGLIAVHIDIRKYRVK